MVVQMEGSVGFRRGLEVLGGVDGGEGWQHGWRKLRGDMEEG